MATKEDIRNIIRQLPFYDNIVQGRTKDVCHILSFPVCKALLDNGIPAIKVGSDLPHIFVMALCDTGLVLVDPTANQFIANYPDVFVGTREELLALQRTHGFKEEWGFAPDKRIWNSTLTIYPYKTLYTQPGSAEEAAELVKIGRLSLPVFRAALKAGGYFPTPEAGQAECAKLESYIKRHELLAGKTEEATQAASPLR